MAKKKDIMMLGKAIRKYEKLRANDVIPMLTLMEAWDEVIEAGERCNLNEKDLNKALELRRKMAK